MIYIARRWEKYLLNLASLKKVNTIENKIKSFEENIKNNESNQYYLKF